MSETVEGTFDVLEIVNGDVWLKQQSTGFIVAVEARRVGYSTEIRKQIKGLSPEEIIEATLESQNTMNTIWAFQSIKPL